VGKMKIFRSEGGLTRRDVFYGTLGFGAGLALKPRRVFAEDIWKVAWVQVGPVGDAGWTFQQDRARQEVEKQLSWVKTMQVENVSPSDTQRVVEDLIGQGAKVLMVQEPTVMDLVIELGKKYPDKYFLVANAWKSAPNVGGFYGHMEEPYYLSGLIAGKMTKSNTIGFVGPFPVPTIIQAIDGFALGVKATNPAAKVRLVWTQSWYNPPHEREAAQSLLNVGADVLGQFADSPTVVQTAEAAGKWGVGSNSDLSSFAPKGYLTGHVWHWTGLFVKILTELRNGTWKPGTQWGNLADGTVQLGPLNKAIPADVVALVEKSKQEIIDGRLRIFTGPIKDNTGKEQIPAGVSKSESEVTGQTWLADNIEGTIPH
jgi:basic membrane protein A and related proteins